MAGLGFETAADVPAESEGDAAAPVLSMVTAISWDRVHLSVTVALSDDVDTLEPVEFKIVDRRRALPVDAKPLGNGHYLIEINVTNFHHRRQVPDGTWRIVPYLGGVECPPARYDLRAMEALDRDSRTFLYAKNSVAYVVGFGISESDDNPAFLMRVYQMFRRTKASPKKRPWKQRIVHWLLPRARRVKLQNRLYRLARRLNPPRGNRILFASEMRTEMEGNLKRVHERMVERGLDSRFRFRYSFRVPRTSTKLTTMRTIYLLATSDIVLIDDYFGMLEGLKISPETKIIQLWHAGSGFKAVGYSRFGTYGSPKLHNAHRKYTYAIAGSTHLVSVYAEAFGIEESAVIPTGLPRVDTFLNPERTQSVVNDFFATYPEFAGKKIILFAPTFRGRSIHDAFYDFGKIDFAKLYEMCVDTDSVVLFRMHHFVRMPVPIPPEYGDRLRDFAAFPETNDLLHVSDVLITDYSSVIYEFSLLNKPMLFYVYDKDVYAATRRFHRPFDETAPGRVCETFDDLLMSLRTGDHGTWKIESFRRENFDWFDTGSADRVIDWLILSDPRTEPVGNNGHAGGPGQSEAIPFGEPTEVAAMNGHRGVPATRLPVEPAPMLEGAGIDSGAGSVQS